MTYGRACMAFKPHNTPTDLIEPCAHTLSYCVYVHFGFSLIHRTTHTHTHTAMWPAALFRSFYSTFCLDSHTLQTVHIDIETAQHSTSHALPNTEYIRFFHQKVSSIFIFFGEIFFCQNPASQRIISRVKFG